MFSVICFVAPVNLKQYPFSFFLFASFYLLAAVVEECLGAFNALYRWRTAFGPLQRGGGALQRPAAKVAHPKGHTSLASGCQPNLASSSPLATRPPPTASSNSALNASQCAASLGVVGPSDSQQHCIPSIFLLCLGGLRRNDGSCEI